MGFNISIKKNTLTMKLQHKITYGSGGDYLSNEIFYRVSKLRKKLKPTLPTGHFHIAKLQDEQSKEDFSKQKTKDLINIVKVAINKGVTGI